MPRRIISIACGSSTLGLLNPPSLVGSRMQPNPRADTSHPVFPNFLYCILAPIVVQYNNLSKQALEEAGAK
jgi:hypothetical protein